ncbi:hypothetical protein EST38_g12221 [Candolleomyces aberdarensis]|uniref:Uncharacterized protein n=1 Tax=Candolleomyces aberdarensis TaxID=2316362 RepID=A0A4Q2D576_9AGAR|nr:hypothetical protein EST38_g12221 [Candolleomyces aberdarensis]
MTIADASAWGLSSPATTVGNRLSNIRHKRPVSARMLFDIAFAPASVTLVRS